MRSDWWKRNQCMMSVTRPPVKYIRRGEEGVRASDLGPSENQARARTDHNFFLFQTLVDLSFDVLR